jgi:hypothetical protein
MRRTMEDEQEAFKRDWHLTHQPAAAPTDPPRQWLAEARRRMAGKTHAT